MLHEKKSLKIAQVWLVTTTKYVVLLLHQAKDDDGGR